MISWIHKRMEGREEGFTLIELLVVVIIIGILAAIAIPVFLSQRERAWRGSVQSDLRNGAVAMETYFTDEGTYAAAGLDPAYGFAETEDVTVTAPTVGDTYCLEGVHANNTAEVWNLQPSGGLAEGACTATP